MSNMVGCVFLPAVGSRHRNTGALSDQGTYGNYWSGMQLSNTMAYQLYFNNSSSSSTVGFGKASGRIIRCVQDVQGN